MAKKKKLPVKFIVLGLITIAAIGFMVFAQLQKQVKGYTSCGGQFVPLTPENSNFGLGGPCIENFVYGPAHQYSNLAWAFLAGIAIVDATSLITHKRTLQK